MTVFFPPRPFAYFLTNMIRDPQCWASADQVRSRMILVPASAPWPSMSFRRRPAYWCVPVLTEKGPMVAQPIPGDRRRCLWLVYDDEVIGYDARTAPEPYYVFRWRPRTRFDRTPLG